MIELSLAAILATSCFGQWAHLPPQLNNQSAVGFSVSVSPSAFVSMQFTDMGRVQAQGATEANGSVSFSEDGDEFVLKNCTSASATIEFSDGRSFALTPLEGDFWDVARARGWRAHGETAAPQQESRNVSAGQLLWQNLSSGMTAEQVGLALRARGIRSQAGQDANGLPTLTITDRVDAAGRRAALSAAFQRSGLFWVELEYSLGASEDWVDHFSDLTQALSGTYGAPLRADRFPRDLTTPNGRRLGMLVQRQDALFERDGLRVQLTSSYLGVPSQTSERKVRIRYWRSVDAAAYSRAVTAQSDREQAQRDQALREGL